MKLITHTSLLETEKKEGKYHGQYLAIKISGHDSCNKLNLRQNHFKQKTFKLILAFQSPTSSCCALFLILVGSAFCICIYTM